MRSLKKRLYIHLAGLPDKRNLAIANKYRVCCTGRFRASAAAVNEFNFQGCATEGCQ